MLASRRSSLEASAGAASHLAMEFGGQQPQEAYFHPSAQQLHYSGGDHLHASQGSQSGGGYLIAAHPSFGPYSSFPTGLVVPARHHLQHHPSSSSGSQGGPGNGGMAAGPGAAGSGAGDFMSHPEDEHVDMMMNSITYAKESWFILDPPSQPATSNNLLPNHFDAYQNLGNSNTNHYLQVPYSISTTPPPHHSGIQSGHAHMAMPPQSAAGGARPYGKSETQQQLPLGAPGSLTYYVAATSSDASLFPVAANNGESPLDKQSSGKSLTPKRTPGASLSNPKRSRARTSSSSEESSSTTSGDSMTSGNELGSDRASSVDSTGAVELLKGMPPMPPKSRASVASSSKSTGGASRPKKPASASRSSSTGSATSSVGGARATSSLMTISSTFRGVSVCGKDRKFQARIRDGAKVHYLGRFSNELEAALQYDKAAREYKGNQAVPNFVPMDEATERALKKAYNETGRVEPEFMHLMLASKNEIGPRS